MQIDMIDPSRARLAQVNSELQHVRNGTAPQQFSNYAAQPVSLQRFSSVPMTSLVQQQQPQLQCTCGQPHDTLEMNELTAQCQYSRAAPDATFDNGVLLQQSPSRQITSNGGRYLPPNAAAYLMARPQQPLVERPQDTNEFRRVAPGVMDASELAAGSRHAAARRPRAQRTGPYEALYNEQQLQQQLGMRQPLYLPANPADFPAQQATADFTGSAKSHSSNNIASHQQTWALVPMDNPLAQQQLMQQQQQQPRQPQQQAQFTYYTAGRMSRRSGPVGLGETVSDMGGGGRFDPLGQQLIPIELRHSGRFLNQQPQAITANMAALRSNRAGALSPQPQRVHSTVPQHFYEQQRAAQRARALYLSQTPQALPQSQPQAQPQQQLPAQESRAFVTHHPADAMRSANESFTRVPSSSSQQQQQQQAAVGRIESSQSRTSTPAAAYEITV